MSGSREQILALARTALPHRRGVPDVPRAYRSAGSFELGRSEVLALFEQRVADYGARTRGSIAEALDAHRAHRVAVAPGVSLNLDGVEPMADDPPLAEGLDGVVTGCALAIAENGTIVLDGGAASGRRAMSLVPDCMCAWLGPIRWWPLCPTQSPHWWSAACTPRL